MNRLLSILFPGLRAKQRTRERDAAPRGPVMPIEYYESYWQSEHWHAEKRKYEPAGARAPTAVRRHG